MAIPTEPIGSIPRPGQLIGAGQDLAGADQLGRPRDAADRFGVDGHDRTAS